MTITGSILIISLAIFLGWVMARLAIVLVFRPKEPIRFLGFSVQGVFPKNQPLIAARVSESLTPDVIPFDEITNKITHPDNVEKLRPEIELHIDHFLRHKLKETFPMLAMIMGDKTISQLKGAFLSELDQLFPVVMKSYMNNLQKDLDLGKIVGEKIAHFPPDKLEALVYQFAHKEFKLYELAGAVAGFLIGVLQLFVLFLTH